MAGDIGGDERRLHVLRSALLAPESGRIVAVTGRLGTGKTTICRAAVEIAGATGGLVLTARPGRADHAYGFDLVRRLFEPAMRETSAAQRVALFNGPSCWAAQVFDPTRLRPVTDCGDPGYETLYGLTWLAVRRAGAGRLTLVVDDADRADPASLAWLAFLVRRIDTLPITLVLGLSQERLDPIPASQPLADLVDAIADQSAEHLTLHDLAAADVAETLRRGWPREWPLPDDVLAECIEVTGGNPRLLRELHVALAPGGRPPTPAEVRGCAPAAVARWVRGRLQDSCGRALRVAELLAVLAEDSSPEVVYGVEPAAEPGVDTLVRHRLVTLGEVLRLRPIVANALRASLTSDQRRILCGLAAGALRAAGRPARHALRYLLDSGPIGQPWAAELLRDTAISALAQARYLHANQLARRLLQEPLQESDRAVAMLVLDCVRLCLSEQQPVDHEHEDAVIASARDAPVESVLVCVDALIRNQRLGPAEALIKASLPTAGPAMAQPLRDRALAIRLVQADTVRAALEELTAHDPERAAVASMLRAVCAGRPMDDPGASLDRAERLLRADLPHGSRRTVSPLAPLVPATVLLLGGRPAVVAQQAERWLSHLRAEDHLSRMTARLLRAEGNYAQGHLDDVEADLLDVLDGVAPSRLVHTVLTASALSRLCHVYVEQANADRAWEVLERASATGALPDLFHHQHLLLARGRVQAAAGRIDGAVADFRRCGERSAAWGADNPTVTDWRSRAALLLHGQGRSAEAVDLASRELQLAESFGVAVPIAAARRRLTAIADGPDAVTELRQALALLAGTTAALEVAKTRAELGAALLRRRDPAADAELRSALELARRCGARRLERRVTSLLPSQPLTHTEHKVALLAAAGRTNRAIAEELNVVARTVEIHLSATYRKLGIRGRADLLDALTAAGYRCSD